MNLNANSRLIMFGKMLESSCSDELIQIIAELADDPSCAEALNRICIRKYQIPLGLIPEIPCTTDTEVIEEAALPTESVSYCTDEKSGECIFIDKVLIEQVKAIWSYMNGHWKHRATLVDPNDQNLGKIDAIKYLRSQMDLGLYNAKCIVETYCNPF